MYRSIVVPPDGSPFAELALAAAVEIARRSGGRLRLVRVREQAPAYVFASAFVQPDGGMPLAALAGDPQASEEHAYLAALAERLRLQAGREVAVEVLDGPVVASVCEAAARLDDALIVRRPTDEACSGAHGGEASRTAWRTAPARSMKCRPAVLSRR